MLLLIAVNLKQAVASTCEHDKKNLDSPVPAIMKPALLLSLKKKILCPSVPHAVGVLLPVPILR